MNKLIALLLTASLSFLSAGTVAAERVSSSAAASYVGDMVTVSGTVSQVTTSGNGTTFINYGGRYPNHHFYGVVFRDNSRAFGSLRNLVSVTSWPLSTCLDGRIALSGRTLPCVA